MKKQMKNHLKHQIKTLTAFVAVALSTLLAPQARAVDVVTSIPELGAIAKDIGGGNVSVYSIAQPNRDYHTIEPRASDVQRISRAGLLVRSGLGLDIWMNALMNAAGNKELNRGGSRYVDASESIPRIEVPKESISGASGDVHPEGNPHYYFDPIYAKYIARNIVKGLIRVDAKNADDYRKRYAAFNKSIDSKMEDWKKQLAPFRGEGVVTYHKNYNYFLRRFGLYQYGTFEPKPGLPPSANHVAGLIKSMKSDKIRAVLVESIYSTRWPEFLKRQTGISYVVGPFSVDNMNEGSYFKFIDKLVNDATQACKQ